MQTSNAPTAPRYSDTVESTFATLNMPADLSEAMRGLPDHKREEVEQHLIPALTEMFCLMAENGALSNSALNDLCAKRPPDVAETIIKTQKLMKGKENGGNAVGTSRSAAPENTQDDIEKAIAAIQAGNAQPIVLKLENDDDRARTTVYDSVLDAVLFRVRKDYSEFDTARLMEHLMSRGTGDAV